jgi:hypothetical protein
LCLQQSGVLPAAKFVLFFLLCVSSRVGRGWIHGGIEGFKLERTIVWKSINQTINQSIKKKNLGPRGGQTERLLLFVGIIIVGGFVLWS